MSDIPVTVRAARSGAIFTMPGHGAERFEHLLQMPAGLCPRSGNPQPGSTLRLRYPGPRVLEVVALHRLVQGDKRVVPGGNPAKSSEGWVRFVADTCADALGVAVEYRLDMVVEPGAQRLIVEGVSCSST